MDAAGRILSWGNSFHPTTAPQPTPFTPASTRANDDYCESLATEISKHQPSGPWSLVKSAAKAALGLTIEDAQKDEKLRHLFHHHGALCRQSISGESMLDPVDALAHILPSLNPSAQPIAVGSISSHTEHTLAPKPAPAEPPTQHITGEGLATAGVVNPVPARLVYTQTDSGAPRLAWKLEIEMQDNWYEAYVDSFSGEIVRIVDWASDISWPTSDFKGGKQKPLPTPHKSYKPYSYHVFPWGESESSPVRPRQN